MKISAPAGWITVGEAAPDKGAITDGPFGSNLKTEHYSESGARVIRLQNVGDGCFIDRDAAFISQEHFKRLKKHEALADDVIVAILGDRLPRACLVPSDLGPSIVKADCVRVRCGSKVEPRYLMHMLNAPTTRLRAETLVSGIGRQRLSVAKIRNIQVPYRPIDEQRSVVALIEEQFSRLDVAELAVSRSKDKAALLSAAALEEAACISAPRQSLGDLEAPGRKISYGVLQPGENVTGGVSFVRVGDISRGRIAVENLKTIAPDIALAYPRTELQGGEVLLTIVGTIGRAAVVPLSLAGANVARAVAVLPMSELVVPEFLSMVLNARSSRAALTRAAHEVARKTLNLEDVRKFMLPLPSIPIQRGIVAAVERQSSILDAVTCSAETAIARSQRLRYALLRAAFCGEFGEAGI